VSDRQPDPLEAAIKAGMDESINCSRPADRRAAIALHIRPLLDKLHECHQQNIDDMADKYEAQQRAAVAEALEKAANRGYEVVARNIKDEVLANDVLTQIRALKEPADG
jgi:hypothetical protein